MILLLRRPIRHWENGTPGRVIHRYRLLNLFTQEGCAATYKGVSKDGYWFPWKMRTARFNDWRIVKPRIELPHGA